MSTALVQIPPSFVAYRPIFSFLGRTMRLESPSSQLVLFVRMKLFKLREELTGYADEAQSRPVIRIKARSVFDFGATYDVTDSTTGQRVGAWRRQGMKSILRDTWTLLDAEDREVGQLQEDSMALALIRRFLLNLIPQSFTFSTNGKPVGTVKQRFNLLRLTYEVKLGPEAMDARLAAAIAVLLMAIEGRQQ